MDDIEPAASSTLSEEGRTSMSKTVKEAVPLRFIYDAHLKSLARELVLFVEEDLRREVYTFLGDPSYNLPRAPK